MKRLVLAVVVVYALCVPLLAAAADVDATEAAFVETMTELGAPTTLPGRGADVAVGRGNAEPCPGGVPFPGSTVPCGSSPREFVFAAASNLSADNAEGIFHETGTNFCTAPDVCFVGGFRARVNCLTAVGNAATIGMIVQSTDVPTFTEGEQLFVSVVDNGRNGDPLPDLISLNFRRPAVVVTGGQCPDVATTAYQVVLDGDIMVRDGQVSSS